MPQEIRTNMITHVLLADQALCQFQSGPPALWPPGHQGIDKWNPQEMITCQKCKELYKFLDME